MNNEKAQYMATLTVQPLSGNVGFTVNAYGNSIETAKKIAMQNLNELCAKYKFPIGEICKAYQEAKKIYEDRKAK